MDPTIALIAPIVTLVGGVLITLIVMRNRERDETGAALARSETNKLFELGFERAPMGIGYLARDGSWIHVNHRMLQMLGYESSAFLRTNLRTLTHSEDRKREAGMMAAVRSGRTRGFTINKRLRKSDGSYEMFHFTIVRVGGGAHHVYQCIIDEISEEVELQNDIVAMFDQVPEVSVIRLDPEGMVTSWNRGAEELFGYGAAEMEGKAWARIHATTTGRAGEATKELALAASSGRFEGTDSRKRVDDSVLSVEVVIVPQFRGKDLTGFIEIARDATLGHTAHEYKAAYERLKTLSEDKISSLTESNEALRKQVNRHSEVETSLRDAQERLRESNRELTSRIKVFSAAVRKLVDQRNELEETIRTEREEREGTSEELATALPADLEWKPINGEGVAIVSAIAGGNRDGVLVLRSVEGEKRFTLRSGSIAACSSDSLKLLLGEMLVDEEAITESDRLKMIEVQNQTGIAFGRLLLLFELMSEEQIRDAMERKIHREIDELRGWSGGVYAFFESEIEPLQVVPVEVPAPEAEPVDHPRAGQKEEDTAAADPAKGPKRRGKKKTRRKPADEGQTDVPEAEESVESSPSRFVSSRSSRTTKFHLESCSAVSRIPEESREVFESVEEAEARGLSPCKRCLPDSAEELAS